ncbi:hypothetical protein FB451DRAFT_1385207 [Mycena latifolia]|nr:hypothetical protein FB451DRAFT_1385207 [Mycena latifolia]
MSSQNRFRYIAHFSRKDVAQPIEQFQQAMIDAVKAWDVIPFVQRNLLHRELCFSMGTSSIGTMIQGLSLPGNAASCDAILTVDVESLEIYEAMFSDPEVIKLTHSSKYRDIERQDVILSQQIVNL